MLELKNSIDIMIISLKHKNNKHFCHNAKILTKNSICSFTDKIKQNYSKPQFLHNFLENSMQKSSKKNIKYEKCLISRYTPPKFSDTVQRLKPCDFKVLMMLSSASAVACVGCINTKSPPLQFETARL